MPLKNRRSSLDIGILAALFQAGPCVPSKVEIPNEIQGNAIMQYTATKGAVNGEPERFVR
jgi:hypothetical protein